METTDRRIARTVLTDGKTVSTIWTGLDMSHGFGPPLIFETIVFSEEQEPFVIPLGTSVELIRRTLECRRYSTEDEARVGHRQAVRQWEWVARHRKHTPSD